MNEYPVGQLDSSSVKKGKEINNKQTKRKQKKNTIAVKYSDKL